MVSVVQACSDTENAVPNSGRNVFPMQIASERARACAHLLISGNRFSLHYARYSLLDENSVMSAKSPSQCS